MNDSKILPFVLLQGLIFGSSMVVSRFSLGQFDPRAYVSLRLLIAGLAHASVYGLIRSRPFPRDRSLWMRAGTLGVMGPAIPMVCVVSSLQYMASSVASLLITLNPVLVVLMSHFFLADERLSWRRLLGVLVAFGGAAILLIQGETGLGHFVQADWRGYAWLLGGMISSAAGSVYAHRYLRKADAFDVASIRMFAAGLVLVPLTSLTVGYDLSRLQTSGLAALIYAGIVGAFLALVLAFYILKRFGAPGLSLSSYVVPVVTAVLGVIFLHEKVTPTMIASTGVIFLGIALLNYRPRMPREAQIRP
jgi:drug/metabolite transporter (DMT)-like permease